MKTTFTGVKLTEREMELIVKKLKTLDKYFRQPDEEEMKVEVNRRKDYKVEITIPLTHFILRAEHEDKEILTAIDEVIEKLERQLDKYKARLSRKNHSKLAFDLMETDEEEKDIIVKTKTIQPKPMDFEEAIMQMELLGHNFFVYKDMETEQVSVVYKRHDGTYGLIETN